MFTKILIKLIDTNEDIQPPQQPASLFRGQGEHQWTTQPLKLFALTCTKLNSIVSVGKNYSQCFKLGMTLSFSRSLKLRVPYSFWQVIMDQQ